jgi:hypothetical protein
MGANSAAAIRVRATRAHSPGTGAGMRVALDPVMSDYPVQVDVSSPPHFARMQLLLRLALGIALGWLGITAGWLVCALYGLLPLVAAVAASSVDRDKYQTEFAPPLWRPLRWLLGFWAYMTLLVDRFPTERDDDVRIAIRFTGQPSIGSALLRLITSIPSGLVLGLLWMVSGVLWVIAAVVVLIGARMPRSILAFQRGVLRWNARLVAYHASLVDEYPPFSFSSQGDVGERPSTQERDERHRGDRDDSIDGVRAR